MWFFLIDTEKANCEDVKVLPDNVLCIPASDEVVQQNDYLCV